MELLRFIWKLIWCDFLVTPGPNNTDLVKYQCPRGFWADPDLSKHRG